MNLRQTFILILYILLFWICLPAILVLASLYMDSTLELDRTNHPLMTIAGLLVLSFSVPLLTLSIIQFKIYSNKYPISADPPKVFIQKGLFALWRHPIYLFYTVTLLGSAMLWGSRGMILIILPVFIALVAIYILVEEKILRRRFGNTYNHYVEKTGLVIPSFYQLLKIALFLLFKGLFNYEVRNRDKIPDSLPFFLISSHRNYLDPLYLGVAIPYPVRYITTFEMFRYRQTRWFFRALRCIPKKRYLHDIHTGRMIIEALGQDDVIGIFPEGERSWTGTLNTLKPETLNLFQKFYHIPILPVRLIGNFYAWPRWGKGLRLAKITVEIQDLIRVEPAWDLTTLEQRLLEAINPGDLDDPAFHCKSENLAEDISKVVYRCPVCRDFDSIRISGKNEFRCEQCMADHSVDSKYNLSGMTTQSKIAGSLHEIYNLIKITGADIKPMMNGAYPDKYGKLLSVAEYLIAYTINCEFYREIPPRFELHFIGSMILTNRRLIFAPEQEEEARVFPLEDIASVTIESNTRMQLYDIKDRQLLQAVFTKESVLKWQDYITQTMSKEIGRFPNTR